MTYSELFAKENEEVKERYELVISGIKSNIEGETENIVGVVGDYFKYVAKFVNKLNNVYKLVIEDKLKDMSLEKLEDINRDLYGDITGENYNYNFSYLEYIYLELFKKYDL